jgi:hypothetical protein
MFWVPETDKLVTSAWATFEDIPGTPMLTTDQVNRQLKTSLTIDVKSNIVSLGDFSHELAYEQEERLVDDIIINCGFYSAGIPKTYKQAQKSSDWDRWKMAVEEELGNLDRKQVWEVKLMDSPKQELDGRWVFAIKTAPDGTITRYKARYVAKGFTQVKDIDFKKTFAPTATFMSMRLVLTLAAAHNWPVHSFDFVAAYLNSDIDEEIWIKPPEGMKLGPGEGLRLKKALYGTRQAARCWWLHLKNILLDLGYSASHYDTSLYVLQDPSKVGVIWIHVDDGIVTGDSIEILQQLETSLEGKLEIKWSESLDSIAGVDVTRSPGTFTLSQKKLITEILDSHWDGFTTAKTPLPANVDINSTQDGDPNTSTAYLSIVMSLSYLAVGTRPDLSFAVNFLARFSASPGPSHWKGVRHLVNYLAHSRDQVLVLRPTNDTKALKCYCDASWGGEHSKSTYGIFVTFLGCPILWSSRRLATVAASTCEAEYMALGIATRQVLWVRHLLKDILRKDFKGNLFCDNQSAVKISTDDSSNKRARHTDREFHVTNQALYQKKTELTWIPTKEQLADILTKSLTREPFERLRHHLLGS